MGDAGWSDYVAGFHATRPGITEQLLHRSRAGDGDAYDWLVEAVSSGGGRVLDVACGSAPVRPRLPGRAYVGVDLSAAELAGTGGRGRGALVRASATALPIVDGGVEVVVCAMALQILTPLPTVLAEIGRVLAPDGRLVAIVPDRGPLRVVDLPVVAGLLAALGHGLSYPNDGALRRLPDLLDDAGLRLVADERRRFSYPLGTATDADLFLASLYLPGVSGTRYRAARAFLRALARAGPGLPVPVRRVVAVRL